MIGHSSVERPRSVSTESNGEFLFASLGENGKGNGVAVGCVVVVGGVPRERAVMTS